MWENKGTIYGKHIVNYSMGKDTGYIFANGNSKTMDCAERFALGFSL